MHRKLPKYRQDAARCLREVRNLGEADASGGGGALPLDPGAVEDPARLVFVAEPAAGELAALSSTQVRPYSIQLRWLCVRIGYGSKNA